MPKLYEVKLEVGDPVRYADCPNGFVIFKGKLAMKSKEGVIRDDGEFEFLALPEDRAYPVKIKGTRPVI